jgi:O-antigen/teichoic acid export membrane protein
MLLLAANTVGAKIINLASQIVMARLLLPEAWGLVALALTVTSVAGLALNPGVDDVLVQRQRHFKRYANAAFWMTASCGLLGMLIMFAAAPIGAILYGDWRLVGLIAVSAVSAPFGTLCTLPFVRLRIELRFGALAAISLLIIVLTAALQVLFAWAGFGPYSFVLPSLITAVVRADICWRIAPTPVKAKLQLRRWKLLFGDSLNVFVARVIFTLISFGDYMTLGAMRYPKDDIGYYFFAYNLSTQVIVVLTLSFSAVLMPTLSKLSSDPARQYRAMISTSRMLAFIALPLGLLQAAMSGAIIDVLYSARWNPAKTLLMFLSIGMALNTASWAPYSLVQAQGRFALYLQIAVINLLAFVMAVVPLTYLFGTLGTSIGVMCYLFVASLVTFTISTRSCGGHVSDILSVYVKPTLVSAASVIIGYSAASCMHLSHVRLQGLLQLVSAFVISSMVYLSAMYFVGRGTMIESLTRIVDATPSSWHARLRPFVPR